MAVNLVGTITQYLTPDRIGRISAAFNLDSKSGQSVADISVPSLLAGLASIAVQPGGAQKLVDGVRQHAGALDSRSSAIGGSTNQAVLADKGTQWLSSLFGDQNHVALVGAVAKFLMPGPDPGGWIVTILLGIAGALVGGFLGRAVGWYGPNDAAGFLMALVGALVLLGLYRLTLRRRT